MTARDPASSELGRRLGTGGAVAIGMGSMIGAGVFSVFAPAAGVAGRGLLIGLVVAAVVAFCSATSSAQLAAQFPVSGGTYVYGREKLGDWWGFVAGWGFVTGKSASCAAIAMTFASYVAPAGAQRIVALAGVAVALVITLRGITRTARATAILVAVTFGCLLIVAAAGWSEAGAPAIVGSIDVRGPLTGYDVLQSAGLMFFAFAGFARVATLGEEVRDPARTIPRAVTTALLATLLVYVVVAVTCLSVLGPQQLASSSAPLRDVVVAADWSWARPVVVIGGVAASFGALLALMTGVSRTALAMARRHDLPVVLRTVDTSTGVPRRAELAVAGVVAALVLILDLREAIGFSSFGVLVYYFVANLSALTQRADHRRHPRALQVLGMVGCTALAVTLPAHAAVGAAVVIVAGVLGRAALRLAWRRRAGGAEPPA